MRKTQGFVYLAVAILAMFAGGALDLRNPLSSKRVEPAMVGIEDPNGVAATAKLVLDSGGVKMAHYPFSDPSGLRVA